MLMVWEAMGVGEGQEVYGNFALSIQFCWEPKTLKIQFVKAQVKTETMLEEKTKQIIQGPDESLRKKKSHCIC
jgi:hypothetical protein